jgi:hypothetical protein
MVTHPWPPRSQFLRKSSHPFIRIVQCSTHRWYSLVGIKVKLKFTKKLRIDQYLNNNGYEAINKKIQNI